MRHERALSLLDGLDARRGYGLGLRLHLARCASCSAAARRSAAALRAYREAPPAAGEEREAELAEDRVMATVRLMPPPGQDFALRDWLLPAAILALSMVLLPIVG